LISKIGDVKVGGEGEEVEEVRDEGGEEARVVDEEHQNILP